MSTLEINGMKSKQENPRLQTEDPDTALIVLHH